MRSAALKKLRPSSVSETFLASLEQATQVKEPFDYWLLDDVLPADTVDAIASLPFDPPSDVVFDGRRESNNSTRTYFTAANQQRFPVCYNVVEAFSDPEVIAAIEAATGANLSQGDLRIEYCQDVEGFWLEPHLDITVKLFTMLVYLSDDPKLFDAGTDIYDSSPAHKLVASVPYEKNRGLIFIPGTNTWHGFSKRPIHGLRKSIIINFVAPEWQNKDELAFYRGAAHA